MSNTDSLKEARTRTIRAMINYTANLEKQRDQSVKRLAAQREVYQAALEQGDHSENADLDISKDAIAKLTMQINDITLRIQACSDIAGDMESHIKQDRVAVGCAVRLYDCEAGGELLLTIYPEGAGNIKNDALSASTPVAKAIMGKKAGPERITVLVPSGTMSYILREVY